MKRTLRLDLNGTALQHSHVRALFLGASILTLYYFPSLLVALGLVVLWLWALTRKGQDGSPAHDFWPAVAACIALMGTAIVAIGVGMHLPQFWPIIVAFILILGITIVAIGAGITWILS